FASAFPAPKKACLDWSLPSLSSTNVSSSLSASTSSLEGPKRRSLNDSRFLFSLVVSSTEGSSASGVDVLAAVTTWSSWLVQAPWPVEFWSVGLWLVGENFGLVLFVIGRSVLVAKYDLRSFVCCLIFLSSVCLMITEVHTL